MIALEVASTSSANHSRTGQAKDPMFGTAQAAKDYVTGGAPTTKDKTIDAQKYVAGTAQNAKDRTLDATQATTKDKASETYNAAGAGGYMGAAQEKLSATAQSACNTAQYGKEKAGEFIQGTARTVQNAAAGATETVTNTLGMGGNKDGTVKKT